MNMYIHCLHVRLGKKNLHYIQPLLLCVQMSLESEMSHQRFRFLLQSGVWHLFPTLSFVCLVQHVLLSPKLHDHATMLSLQQNIYVINLSE